MHHVIRRTNDLTNSSQLSLNEFEDNLGPSKSDYNAGNNLKNPENNNGDIIGSASDYILIAMIVAMMFCMTVCCLCLFCRSASRFTICGFNFEMNNPTTSIAPEDLSELHEVVPLTPTTAENCQLPDIENMLRSDPPPPRYSDVATSSSMRDRFKWRSRRKATLSSEHKLAKEAQKQKTEEALSSSKSKSTSVGSKSRSRIPFQRSVSYQTTRTSNISANASLPSHISASSDEHRQSKRGGIFASFRLRSTRLPQTASESSISSKPASQKHRNISEVAKMTETIAADSNVKFDLSDCTETESKESGTKSSSCNAEGYNDDDDEVFM
uniref:Uncharacterized protein LOC100175365 n=1 Tax=Phallusia mammillata TaxID=59560 RepID=A0A6F9DFK3_9ASCI|nr:uncharacterized protein LOC100175365 [Phallusia mammillata]